MSNLTEEQLQSLKNRLTQRADELREVIHEESARSAGEQFRDLAGSVPDEGDQSVADMLIDVNNAVIGSQLAELRDIQSALERINEGSYGICMDCGQDIAYARLAVASTAKRCTLCQTQRERTYANDSRARL
ncbi:MAG: TraR/DksA C4-type zinc finger protein [Pseudomonadota bacterium]